ncbi:MAG: RNA-binding domain-containing protein [Thermoprotei archaeon]
MKITVKVEARFTEDENKVLKALYNVFTPEKIDIIEGENGKIIIAFGSDINSLQKLKELIRKSYILDAARKVIKSASKFKQGIIEFYLNKQAAYMGKISFSAPEKESALGPIIITVETNNSYEFLDWIAPKSRESQRQEAELERKMQEKF